MAKKAQKGKPAKKAAKPAKKVKVKPAKVEVTVPSNVATEVKS
jgi:ubiquitin